MAWLARNKADKLYLYRIKPYRYDNRWFCRYDATLLTNDFDTIYLDTHISWENEPIEIVINIKNKI